MWATGDDVLVYLPSQKKTAPGVSMGSALVEIVASVEVVVGTLLLSNWPSNFSEHPSVSRYGTYSTPLMQRQDLRP